jgi:F420-non-reducing hydrogenase large subunit
MKTITIDPITRLEGHGKIEIFLTDEGEVDNVYFQVPELRGFEKFCEGRPVEELPSIVTKICGVCPGCHHMASGKAVDAVFGVEPPPTAKKLRELFYMAHFVHSHIAHFYALAAPDLLWGRLPARPNATSSGSSPKSDRDRIRSDQTTAHCPGDPGPAWRTSDPRGHEHPGWSEKGLTEENRDDIVKKAEGFIEFSKFSMQLFKDVVLGNKDYVDLILNGPYSLKIHSMGLVDKDNKVNFYDGKVRVVDTVGKELYKYAPKDYMDYVEERVEPWTYLKFPYLKQLGWKGFVDGQESGVYQATPLSRLNAADGMATPLAQKEYEYMYETLGGKPVHATLAMHWARLIELMYSAEHCLELATDPEITGTELRAPIEKIVGEGVGIVEAQRGTLTHHYWTDDRGMVKKVNLIVGTTNNHAAICMSLKKAAQGLIKKGIPATEGTLNMIEMAFRAYDPCFSCATHSLPGQMKMAVNFYNSKGELIRSIGR